MSWERWNNLLVVLLALAALGVPAFNVVTDPYGVFGVRWKHDSAAFNERYLKLEHLMKHPSKHDAFVLGSSMMGSFDPNVLNATTPGLSWYNLAFLGGTPRESLDALQALRKHGIVPKAVLVGIDFFPFRQDDSGEGSPSRYPHYIVTGEHPWLWYRHFLYASSFVTGATRVLGSGGGLPYIEFDIEGGGRYRLIRQEAEMAKDPAGYANRHLPRSVPVKGNGSDVAWVESRFEDLAKLAGWLDTNKVKAHYFVHPFNHRLLDSVSGKSMAEFRARVRSIVGDLQDFSTDDGMTRNDLNYFDTKHYTQAVANEVIERVLGNTAKASTNVGSIALSAQ